jgi:hypothetical protein
MKRLRVNQHIVGKLISDKNFSNSIIASMCHIILQVCHNVNNKAQNVAQRHFDTIPNYIFNLPYYKK